MDKNKILNTSLMGLIFGSFAASGDVIFGGNTVFDNEIFNTVIPTGSALLFNYLGGGCNLREHATSIATANIVYRVGYYGTKGLLALMATTNQT